MKRLIKKILRKYADRIMRFLYYNSTATLRNEMFDRAFYEHQMGIYEGYRQRYNIHESFIFNGRNIQLYGDGKIICGEKSYIGALSTVQAFPGCKVVIGNNCRISHNVRIYTSSNVADQDFCKEKLKIHFSDVIIENNVWIGANVFINPGITIGNNSVVGANSVVTADVMPFSIVGGVPAKLIKKKSLSNE